MAGWGLGKHGLAHCIAKITTLILYTDNPVAQF